MYYNINKTLREMAEDTHPCMLSIDVRYPKIRPITGTEPNNSRAFEPILNPNTDMNNKKFKKYKYSLWNESVFEQAKCS